MNVRELADRALAADAVLIAMNIDGIVPCTNELKPRPARAPALDVLASLGEGKEGTVRLEGVLLDGGATTGVAIHSLAVKERGRIRVAVGGGDRCPADVVMPSIEAWVEALWTIAEARTGRGAADATMGPPAVF